MTYFNYRDQILHVESVALSKLAAEFSTPCYVYSRHAISQNWARYAEAFAASQHPYKIFYAIKANSNIAILNLLAKLGAGFDAVSGGEIDRVLAAGGAPQNIVFSGVGKNSAEISKAIDLGIHSINIESHAELLRVQAIAQQKNKQVEIALRINPDIDANSHPYISTGSKENKFGIDYQQAVKIFTLAANMANIKITGISCHIGSQITSLAPFMQAIDQLLAIIQELAAQNIKLRFINIGGGLGVTYQDETPPSAEQYVQAIVAKLKNLDLEIHIEPGRSIIADTGVLLTKVEYIKTTGENKFAIVDAAMNDLMRPCLYNSYHEIVPVIQPAITANTEKYTIVGPICESSDFLAKDRYLALQAGDLLAIKNTGAYGFSMSSNYNTRPRCAEILVDQQQAYVIRQRETIEQLLQNEQLIDVR